jgi:PPM family protein phosphatase
MEIRPGIEIANLTDVGCDREKNEDYFCYWEPQSEEQFCLKGRLAIIADGMGGEKGGQVASRLAADAVRDAYLSDGGAGPQAALLEGFKVAHEIIRKYARDHPELTGMGTTCTAVAISDRFAYFAHIGDSRLYLVRASGISCLTHDHTYVNRLIEQGVVAPEEAAVHPQRHVLTGALGGNGEVGVDVPESPVQLLTGDTLVLCTDGLWGQVSDAELHSIIRSKTPREACKELVHLAKLRGGPDNITVQILRQVDSTELN